MCVGSELCELGWFVGVGECVGVRLFVIVGCGVVVVDVCGLRHVCRVFGSGND